MKKLLPVAVMLLCLACKPGNAQEVEPTIPLTLEATDSAFTAALFGDSLHMEVLFSGKGWLESPLVLPSGDVICSDVENNQILRWTGKGSEVYLERSGGVPDDYSREPGSNGLTLDQDGKLLLCQHGARRIVRLENDPLVEEPVFTVLADSYEGKAFNSPNDLVVTSDGSILFTDPPYGLPEGDGGDLGMYGVYRVDTSGEVTLLTKSFTRPNGIDLDEAEGRLYVSQSDGEKPVIAAMAYRPGQETSFLIVELFDTNNFPTGVRGAPDGFELDGEGRLFATVPGGVWIIDLDTLQILSKIGSDRPVSNLTISPGRDWLYLTNDDRLVRVKLNPI